MFVAPGDILGIISYDFINDGKVKEFKTFSRQDAKNAKNIKYFGTFNKSVTYKINCLGVLSIFYILYSIFPIQYSDFCLLSETFPIIGKT